MAHSRRLLAVFLVGLLVGIAVTTAAGLGFEQSMSVAVPSVSVTSTCGGASTAGDWAAQIPNRGYETVLVNRSVDGRVANATLKDDGRSYRLVVQTAADGGECRYDAAVTLPTQFESLTVVHDGRTVVSITNDEDAGPRFWPPSDTRRAADT